MSIITQLISTMVSWGVKSDDRSKAEAVEVEDGCWRTLNKGRQSGRNPDSDNNYDAVKQECNKTRVVGVTETLISGAPCYLMGVYANNGSSGYTSARDAAATGGGGTAFLDVVATAGNCPDLKAQVCTAGLTVQGSAAGTDVTIMWRPI